MAGGCGRRMRINRARVRATVCSARAHTEPSPRRYLDNRMIYLQRERLHYNERSAVYLSRPRYARALDLRGREGGGSKKVSNPTNNNTILPSRSRASRARDRSLRAARGVLGRGLE